MTNLGTEQEKKELEENGEQDASEPVHGEFRNPDGTFKPDHPWAWKKGQSGNPKGHTPNIPHGLKLAEVMKHLAKQKCSLEGYKKLTWGEVFCLKTFEHVVKDGSPGLVKEVLDRVDGPVKQVHEVEAQSRTILEFVIATPPDKKQHEENKQNGKLNGTTKKGE